MSSRLSAPRQLLPSLLKGPEGMPQTDPVGKEFTIFVGNSNAATTATATGVTWQIERALTRTEWHNLPRSLDPKAVLQRPIRDTADLIYRYGLE
jgi:hypothetical protein